MIILEIILLSCVLYLGIQASISDCRYSIIPNRLLLYMLPVILTADAVYYIWFARDYISYALVNLAFVAVFSFFLYSYNLWAAGDSKLLFVMTLAIPARFYTYWILGPFPGFILLAMIFSLAFLYVVFDSVRQGLKRRDLFELRSVRIDIRLLLRTYFFMVGAMTVCNLILVPLVGSIFSEAGLLITAIDFMVIFSLRNIREKLSDKVQLILTILIWAVLIVLQISRGVSGLRPGIDLKAWCVVLVVMFLRFIAEKYNYQETRIDELKPGMIPSAYAVMQFRTSRVKGLPTGMTEDLRSRLTEEELEAIFRWKKTKQGQDTILTVRKIPFAIFIFSGTIVFLLFEVMLIWRI